MKKLKASKQVLTAALSILTANAGSVSYAAPSSIKSGDWVMTDSNPGEKDKGTCIAITAGYYGREVMDLIVRLDKTGARPAEVLIRPRSKASAVKAFKVAAANGKTAIFQKLAASSFGQTMFWYVPNGTEDLLALMKGSRQLTAFAVGGAGSLPFSMGGSSGALNAIINNCAGPAALINANQFEEDFIPTNIGALNPANVSNDSASAARELILSAVTAHKNVLKVEAELARLEAKYAQINAEKRSLDSTLSNLASKLSSLTLQKINAQNTIDTATSEIATYEQNISLKEQELARAQEAASAALAAIRPFVPEHDRLLQIVNSAQGELNSATSRLADLDGQISSNESRVSALENEASDLAWRIRNTQDQESQTQNQLDQAERDFRRFHPEHEIRSRIRNDFQINNLERNIADQRRLSEQLEREVNQNQGARNALESAYTQCMANAGANRVDTIVNAAVTAENTVEDRRGSGAGRGPGEGRRPRDPRPGNPQPNPEPTPQPTPQPPVAGGDCTALANQLSVANNQLAQSRRELERAQENLGDLSRRRAQVVRSIEDEVYRQKEQLDFRARQLAQDLSNLRGQMEQLIARANDVSNYDLPNARNALADSESLRPAAVVRVDSAQSRLNAVTRDFRSYKASVNYDALKATVDQTASMVSGLKFTIANFHQQVAKREALIIEKTNLRNSLTDQIESTNSSIAANQTRLKQVEQSLVPYNSDKAEVVGRLTDKESILAGITKNFAKLLAL